MQRFLTGGYLVVAAVASALALSSCSGGGGGGGFLGLNPGPTGNFAITDASSGAALTTSAAHPDMVTGLRFAIGIHEDHFGGPYSVTNVGSTNVATVANASPATPTVPAFYPYQFNEPCFQPHLQNDPNSQTNVITFTGDNANGNPYAIPAPAPVPPGPAPTPMPTATPMGNPCHSGEFETWAISDSKGHTVYFYDEEP